jgi:hypothetical protein
MLENRWVEAAVPPVLNKSVVIICCVQSFKSPQFRSHKDPWTWSSVQMQSCIAVQCQPLIAPAASVIEPNSLFLKVSGCQDNFFSLLC